MKARMRRRDALIGAGLTLLCLAADWPNFRGPDGLGVSHEPGLPAMWSNSENVVWRTLLPGPGTSSPIVIGERVFVTCYSGYGLDEANPGDPSQLVRHVVCLARDGGEILWQQDLLAELPEQLYQGFLALHGYASSTPATDGERVFAFFGRGGVMAFDLEGTLLWQSSVGNGLDKWGSATSPVLFENLVIINAYVESGALVALDRQTGDEVWRASGLGRSWSTPVLVELQAGEHEVVVSAEGLLFGFHPRTGERLWSCEGVQDYVCPTPLASQGIVYAIGGRRGTALAVRAGGRGDVTDTHVVWKERGGSNVSSPVIYGEHLYWVSDAGIAHCLAATTGETVYRTRIDGTGRVYASVVAADDKLYAVSRENGTFVLAAQPEFKLLSHNQLADDPSVFNASPAVSRGQLLLRSNRYLYCIGNYSSPRG